MTLALRAWCAHRVALRTSLLVTCVALAACAPLPPATDVTSGASGSDVPFTLEGRLSARHGTDALSAHVDWRHAPGQDSITLSSPLGQALAAMTRTPQGVTLQAADGRSLSGASFDQLTQSALGFPIPVEGLAFWARAVAHPGSAYRAERDSAGRVQTLDQDGWSIVYVYADAAATLPRRVTLAYPDIELRMVIDAWH